jgi:hypothetical protein
MKSICIFLLSIFLLDTAAGQIEKPITAHHFLAGGSISYDSKTSKQTMFDDNLGKDVLYTTKEDVFQPNMIFGYYPFSHIAFGLLTDAYTYAQKYTWENNNGNPYKFRESTFSLGPFVRYSTSFGLFVQGSASFGIKKFINFSVESRYKSQSYSIGGGYSFFIKGLLSIEPSISYKFISIPSHGNIEGPIKTVGVFFSLGTYIYLDLTKAK